MSPSLARRRECPQLECRQICCRLPPLAAGRRRPWCPAEDEKRKAPMPIGTSLHCCAPRHCCAFLLLCVSPKRHTSKRLILRRLQPAPPVCELGVASEDILAPCHFLADGHVLRSVAGGHELNTLLVELAILEPLNNTAVVLFAAAPVLGDVEPSAVLDEDCPLATC